MVARHDLVGDAQARAGRRSAAGALFLTWRRWLTTALGSVRRDAPAGAEALRRGFGAVVAATLLVARFLVHPASVTDARDRRLLAGVGLASLGLGAALSLVLAPALHVTTAEAAIAVVWGLGWALVRLGILRLAAPKLDATGVRQAWAAGLLPAVAGVGDIARVVVLLASLWLTIGGLEGGGASRRQARKTAAWAFGAELLGDVVRWLASGALLYVLTAR
jgi:hypothetical protein